jgi:subtilisin family serine protease
MLKKVLLSIVVAAIIFCSNVGQIRGQAPPEPAPLVPAEQSLSVDYLSSLGKVTTPNGGTRYADTVTVIAAESFNSGILKELATQIHLVAETNLFHSRERQLQLSIPDAELEEFVVAAAMLPGVIAAKPSYVRFIQTSDPGWSGQQITGLHLVDLEGYWSLLGDGSPAITVDVLDSGVNEIADLSGRVDAGRNFVNSGHPVHDVVGHGTMIASIIAAEVNNGIGVAGIAPDVRIMPLQACIPTGFPYVPQCPDPYFQLALSWAIGEAFDGNLHVLNLSLGGGPY